LTTKGKTVFTSVPNGFAKTTKVTSYIKTSNLGFDIPEEGDAQSWSTPVAPPRRQQKLVDIIREETSHTVRVFVFIILVEE
jgi:hypothetical protein